MKFTKKQLTLYFTTQSNIITKVEQNKTSYEHVKKLLDRKLDRFYDAEITIHTNYCWNWIKYIQKIN